MNLAKDLGNLAPNICTPTYLAEQAVRIAKAYKLKATVLEQKDMEKLGMGALLAVARGSHQPAKLIALEYWGGGEKGKARRAGGQRRHFRYRWHFAEARGGNG